MVAKVLPTKNNKALRYVPSHATMGMSSSCIPQTTASSFVVVVV